MWDKCRGAWQVRSCPHSPSVMLPFFLTADSTDKWWPQTDQQMFHCELTEKFPDRGKHFHFHCEDAWDKRPCAESGPSIRAISTIPGEASDLRVRPSRHLNTWSFGSQTTPAKTNRGNTQPNLKKKCSIVVLVY